MNSEEMFNLSKTRNNVFSACLWVLTENRRFQRMLNLVLTDNRRFQRMLKISSGLQPTFSAHVY